MELALLSLPIGILAVLIIGIPIVLAVVILLLVRAWVPYQQLEPHHDAAGAIFQGVATLYAIVIAFVVVMLWQQFDAASNRVDKEASAVGNLYRGAQTFSEPMQREVREAVQRYVQAVVEDEWRTMAWGEESLQARQAYGNLWQTIRGVEPRTPAETGWHFELLRTMDTLSELRRGRLSDCQMDLPTPFWILLIAGACVLIGYSYLFGIKNVVANVLVVVVLTGLTTALLFMALILDRPFSGGIRLQPSTFERQLQSFREQSQQPTRPLPQQP